LTCVSSCTMGKWLYEHAQWIGRRSSESRRSASFGFAARRDSACDTVVLFVSSNDVHEGRGREEANTSAFPTSLVNSFPILLFGHDVTLLCVGGSRSVENPGLAAAGRTITVKHCNSGNSYPSPTYDAYRYDK
jgi:hypothetical protein